MSFSEWSNNKKKKKNQTPPTIYNRNSSNNDSSANTFSFSEWSNERHKKNTASSNRNSLLNENITDPESVFSNFVQGLNNYVSEGNSFVNSTQERYKGPNVKQATAIHKLHNNQVFAYSKDSPGNDVNLDGYVDVNDAAEIEKHVAGLDSNYVTPYRGDTADWLKNTSATRDKLKNERNRLLQIYNTFKPTWMQMGLSSEAATRTESILSDDVVNTFDNIVDIADMDNKAWSKYPDEASYKQETSNQKEIYNNYQKYLTRKDFEANSKSAVDWGKMADDFMSQANPDEVKMAENGSSDFVGAGAAEKWWAKWATGGWNTTEKLAFIEDPKRIASLKFKEEQVSGTEDNEKDSLGWYNTFDAGPMRDDWDYAFYDLQYWKIPLFYLNETESKIAIYIYNTEGEDSFNKYLEDLTPTLNARRTDTVNVATNLAVEDLGAAGPVLAGFAQLPNSLLSGVGLVGDLVSVISGNEIDPNSDLNMFSNQANAYVSAGSNYITEHTGSKALGELYGLGTGVLNNLVTAGLSSGIGSFAGLSDKAIKNIGLNIMSSSAATSRIIEAKNNGLDDVTSVLLGVLSYGAEYAGENISWNALFSDKSGGTLKYLLRNMRDEGMEEIITNALNDIGETAIRQGKNKWTDLYNSYISDGNSEEEANKKMWLSFLEEYLKTGAGGALAGGMSSSIVIAGDKVMSKTSGDVNNLTTGERIVAEALFEESVTEMEADGKKLTDREKKGIYNSIVENMKHGQLDINDIERVLGGESYTAYREAAESEDALKKELADLQGMEYGKMNDLQHTRLNELKGMNLNDTTKRDGLRKQLNDKVFPLVKDSYLAESYNEISRKGQAFEADLTKYKGKQRETVQRAIDSGVLNNTYRSHVLVDTLSKIETDKGIVFDYTDNAKLKESGFALEGKTVNGYVTTDGTVALNVQSAKSWQSVVGHEITHVLEGTDAYNDLRNALYAYAESKGELESRRAALTELYKDIDADVEAELTADLIGDYLFTDKNFINHLTTNRNLFQKIYDEIKYLCKVARGKELTEIEKVKREFDKAWKEIGKGQQAQKNTAQSGVRYSLDSGMTNVEGTAKRADELTENDFRNMLENIKYGLLEDSSYIPLRATTPTFFIDVVREHSNGLVEVMNVPMASKVEHLRQNMEEDDGTSYGNKRPHNLSVDDMVKISEKMGDPSYIVLQNNNRYSMVVSFYNEKHKQVLVVVDFASEVSPINNYKYKQYMNGYNEGYYNIIVTQYELDDLNKYLEKNEVVYDKKKMNGKYQVGSGRIVTITHDTPFINNILSQQDEDVNKNSLADEEYLAAIELEDMAAAQSLVDEAAERKFKDSKARDSEGKLIKVYHGTESEDFYKFDKARQGQTDSSLWGRGYYFTSEFDFAEMFGDNVRSFYLNITNPFTVTAVDAPASEIADKLVALGEKVDFDYSNLKAHEFANAFGNQRFSDVLTAHRYDGVIVGDVQSGDVEYVAFEQNQMKLSDPVTYDSEGNTISLSERFNTENEDIRYSISNEAEDIAPVGDFNTPLNDLYYNQDIAPVRKTVSKEETAAPVNHDIAPVKSVTQTNVGNKKTTSETEAIAPVVAENTTTDALITEDIGPVAEEEPNAIQDEKVVSHSATSLEAIQTELANVKKLRSEAFANFEQKIADKQSVLDSKKNKDTKVANDLRMQIERLKRLRDSTDADYSKRISNLETREKLVKERMVREQMVRDHKVQKEQREQLAKERLKAKLARERKPLTIQTVEEKVAENIRAVEVELADNKELRKEAEANYNEQISILKEQYNAIKSVNTKKAYNLLQNISRLERLKASTDTKFAKRISDLEARAVKMKDPTYSRALYRQAKMKEHAKWAEDLLGDISTWVDKKIGLQYSTNTERRNLRDIVRDAFGNKDIAHADAINDAINGRYGREHAELNRELAQIRKKYADLKITRAEDAYIQMLGELRHNPETSLTYEVVFGYYGKHKDKISKGKVDKIIEMARKDYDNLFIRVNEALREQGMKEIPYRQGYFPHTHAPDPKQNFFQKLFNWKTQNHEIPTSIAGLTEDFRPGKSWQAFDKERKGDRTEYSFTKGFDKYSEGALDWIYHLDTIQKRRAVENYIRSAYSEEGTQKRINEIYSNEEYDANEAQAQIDQILSVSESHLSHFVQDFTTHTNILAGKKNSLDRSVEQLTNRHIYSVMTNVQNRMSANMVLANVRSALTNFIPITQSWAQVSPLRSLQATKDTIANAIKDDGVINKSTFLTNRLREADSLYKTGWDKVLDKAGIMFEIVDNFSSQVIWRSKYNQNLAKGMTESEAIKNADQFAENVMAGRSKGNEPTLFNAKNPLVKAFTMFQLEVNNQYGYLFKDVPNDLKAETKHWKFNLAKGFTTAFIGAHVYNALMEQISGSGAALDPIGIIKELLRDLGLFDDDEEKEPDEVVTNLLDNVVEELPFVGGLFGGGRIPISSALPYGDEYDDGLSGFIKDVSDGDWENIGKEMMNPILNIGLPVGGGQLKKTVQGLRMFNTDEEHPVAGSYTDSGNLRFPVEDTIGNRIQAGLFGQYASENAREYFDNDYAPLKEKQIQEYVDVELPIGDYWKYREGLKGLKTTAEKADYINSLDISDWQKNLLMNNILDRKEDVDMSNYDDYSSWEEFDYAQNNPEKYAFAKSVGGYDAYKTYSGELYDIKADKDGNGNSISGSRKEKVLDYINNLDIDYGAKIILWKSEYPSDDTYNEDIINYLHYLNERENISYEEMITILTELDFKVVGDKVYWD